MRLDWARSLRDQCTAAGVPFFFKQFGEYAPIFTAPGEDVSRCNGTEMSRVGKKAAGRLLDGRTWDEMPQSAQGGMPAAAGGTV